MKFSPSKRSSIKALVIEDDETRTLMTATTLKSSEVTISKLQERQKLFFSQAIVELAKASVSRDKLKNHERAW